ncbi:deoxynucleoside kinase [Phytohabitans flavus]|uniref:Thymidylate kinase n=1 Tax=Phytohabitans flavus TaxID=1076124 RepID=A0A6F8Y510_9ACTN|nr:deoxynucleoside kinase [Phytohabitans flavus]BCB81214.1 deoxyguanosine kinase/deoxyadenosine kinase [Phytohabitans flavus]
MSYVDSMVSEGLRLVPHPRNGAANPVGAGRSPFFVAVEGPTGVGKTTLVSRLSELVSAKPFFDPFEANPFLPRLYAAATSEEASRHGLLTELTFVALRVVQLREIRSHLAAGGSILADWSMVKTTAFAAATLEPADQERVARTCALWASDLPTPDLLIHLRADPVTLASRVAGRGRQMERDLTEEYFAALSAAFDAVLPGCGTPVLAVDAAGLDVFDDAVVAQLADHVFEALDSRGERLWSAQNQ